MKNIFIFVSMIGAAILTQAKPCATQTIKYGRDNVELMRIADKPERTLMGQPIPGEAKVLTSGFYMFVRHNQRWNVYRCADEMKRFSLNHCALKNDFEFGNLVKHYGDSGITVRKIADDTLQVKLNVAGGEVLSYYDVQSVGNGLAIVENKFKADKKQPHLGGHEPIALGVCGESQSTTTGVRTSPTKTKISQ